MSDFEIIQKAGERGATPNLVSSILPMIPVNGRLRSSLYTNKDPVQIQTKNRIEALQRNILFIRNQNNIMVAMLEQELQHLKEENKVLSRQLSLKRHEVFEITTDPDYFTSDTEVMELLNEVTRLKKILSSQKEQKQSLLQTIDAHSMLKTQREEEKRAQQLLDQDLADLPAKFQLDDRVGVVLGPPLTIVVSGREGEAPARPPSLRETESIIKELSRRYVRLNREYTRLQADLKEQSYQHQYRPIDSHSQQVPTHCSLPVRKPSISQSMDSNYYQQHSSRRRLSVLSEDQ